MSLTGHLTWGTFINHAHLSTRLSHLNVYSTGRPFIKIFFAYGNEVNVVMHSCRARCRLYIVCCLSLLSRLSRLSPCCESSNSKTHMHTLSGGEILYLFYPQIHDSSHPFICCQWRLSIRHCQFLYLSCFPAVSFSLFPLKHTHTYTHSIFLYHLQAPQQPCIHWLEVISRRQRLEVTLDRDVILPSTVTLPLFLICKRILDECVWRLLSFTLHLCLHVSAFLSISMQWNLEHSLKIFQTCFG